MKAKRRKNTIVFSKSNFGPLLSSKIPGHGSILTKGLPSLCKFVFVIANRTEQKLSLHTSRTKKRGSVSPNVSPRLDFRPGVVK